MSVPPAVEVDSLVKRYGRTLAVQGLSFTVAPATVTAVLGPNGAGKTTTIECCEGYRRADAGAVRVLGLDPIRDAGALRPRVGAMLQDGAGLHPGARSLEVLRHFARLHAGPLDVDVLVERLGLGPAARTPVRRLSGGQRQRLALAVALVGRPEVVFLDEPTAGLDPAARRATWGLVRDLRSDGVTVVLTTHAMDEAELLADQVVIVDGGRRVAAGTPAELTGRADARVRFDGPPGRDLASLRSVLPGPATVTEVVPGQYLVEAPADPHLVAAVTSWCAAHGVGPHSLRVSRKTLEDVFLELTTREPGP